jgi:hypothetical protein
LYGYCTNYNRNIDTAMANKDFLLLISKKMR